MSSDCPVRKVKGKGKGKEGKEAGGDGKAKGKGKAQTQGCFVCGSSTMPEIALRVLAQPLLQCVACVG